MKYTPFDEERFRSAVSRAMIQVQRILDTTRQPRLAEDEDHTYDDKYALAEFLTNTSIAAEMNALERLGLDQDKIIEVMDWVHCDEKFPVTLRFLAEDSCQFIMEQVVEMDTGVTREIEQTTTTKGTQSIFGSTGPVEKTETVIARVLTKVKEYHWRVNVSYKLIIFPGVDLSKAIELQSRSTDVVIITAAGTGTSGSAQSTKIISPLPERRIHQPLDINLTWFFQMLSPNEQTCLFSVNRHDIKACKTPRRNEDIRAAEAFNKNLFEWSRNTLDFFEFKIERDINGRHNPVNRNHLGNNQDVLPVGSTCFITGLHKEPSFNGKRVIVVEYNGETQRYRVEPAHVGSGLPGILSIKPINIQADHSVSVVPQTNFDNINDDAILCPILPLMEKQSVLDMGDVGDFLAEQSRSIDEMVDNLSKVFPPRQLVKLVSVAEATIVLMCKHLRSLTSQYIDGIDYIENMLEKQLVKAIGEELDGHDFEQFMKFHCRKLFTKEYRPTAFSYDVRRPGLYPDGVITIECTTESGETASSDLIDTFHRKVSGIGSVPISIPINAATTVQITGDRYIHGWITNRFQESEQPSFTLASRARQFSSFMVLIGTMSGPDSFEAKHAIILQNKDEVLLPLLTNVLPSAKDFKDAIESLSPEQKAFARAYRSMQLETSLFGICIVQIKPQLEKLLGLPDCALTKEIQLTQDLLSLFVDYQIPCDLMSYSETPGTSLSLTEKVAVVKGHVKAVMDVIENTKQKQLKDEEMKADMKMEMSTVYGSSFGIAAPITALRSARRLKAHTTDATGMMMANTMDNCAFSLSSEIPSPKTLPTKSTERFLLAGTKKSISTFEDFTMIPKNLDVKLENFDVDGALRSTTVKAADNWTRNRQANLLSSPTNTLLSLSEIKLEKKKAFDLLDAISRSGTLPIDCSELHVIVAVTHNFDDDIMGSIIRDNINPIEKVEQSLLLLASAVCSVPPRNLLSDHDEAERVAKVFPLLFETEASS